MSELCIQIQPNRAPALDMASVRGACDVLAAREAIVGGLTSFEGDDDGPYLNLIFETTDLPALWEMLRSRLFQDKIFGTLMNKASIVTCEGSRGWDDYLLLHHFDRTEVLDNFDNA